VLSASLLSNGILLLGLLANKSIVNLHVASLSVSITKSKSKTEELDDPDIPQDYSYVVACIGKNLLISEPQLIDFFLQTQA